MKTNRTERLYEWINVWERISLSIAAQARGDDEERRRLETTAPIRTWKIPEHLMAEQALNTLSLIYITEQLDAAATYFFACGQLQKDEEHVDWLLATAQTAYLFQANRIAWRQFCGELGIDPAPLVSGNYRGWLLQYCEERIANAAPNLSDLQPIMKKLGHSPDRIATSDSLLASWRHTLRLMTRHAPPPRYKELS